MTCFYRVLQVSWYSHAAPPPRHDLEALRYFFLRWLSKKHFSQTSRGRINCDVEKKRKQEEFHYLQFVVTITIVSKARERIMLNQYDKFV